MQQGTAPLQRPARVLLVNRVAEPDVPGLGPGEVAQHELQPEGHGPVAVAGSVKYLSQMSSDPLCRQDLLAAS